jgi:hypothetical protein
VGAGAEDPVLGDRVLALEVPDRAVGVDAEDAVLLARRESQRVESRLQHGDVVSAHRWALQVKGSVAQTPAGFHELAPGMRPDDAVHQDAAFLLERADSVPRVGAEAAGLLGDLVSERAKSRLHVGDLGGPRTFPDEFDHVCASTVSS